MEELLKREVDLRIRNGCGFGVCASGNGSKLMILLTEFNEVLGGGGLGTLGRATS